MIILLEILTVKFLMLIIPSPLQSYFQSAIIALRKTLRLGGVPDALLTRASRTQRELERCVLCHEKLYTTFYFY